MKMLLILITVLLASVPTFAAEHKIAQKDMEFSRKEITITVGDTIVFVNTDTATHNVFSASENFHFDSQMQEPGKSSAVQFSKAGSFDIRCAMHPKMKLKVTVVP